MNILHADEPKVQGLPVLNPRYQPSPEDSPFWTRGEDGEIRFDRCVSCGRFLHPPLPRCQNCGSRLFVPCEIAPQGTVWSYTINYQEWDQGLSVPYVIIIAELEEGVRFTSNLIDVPLEKVRIGLPVQMRMLAVQGLFVPVFERLSGVAL